MNFCIKIILYLTHCILVSNIYPLTIDRVVVAANTNSTYLDFWPIVAKAWKKIVKIQPTLVLISDEHIEVDETVGDVIRFKPIPGVSTALQSQVIRLLIPAIWEDEVWLISDIDMIPLDEGYYKNPIAEIPDDNLVIYRDKVYDGQPRFPMCYVAGKGTVFKEIFNIKNLEDIPKIIKQWSSQRIGWSTDEFLLYQYVSAWDSITKRCARLNYTVERRIDRAQWTYDIDLLNQGYYIDCHSLRPYKKYKKKIDTLLQLVGLLED